MASDALIRLEQEYKQWTRIDNPLRAQGFKAVVQDTQNYFKWECRIPGKPETPWENGLFPLRLEFPNDFPTSPPCAYFPKDLVHPNLFSDGKVCDTLLKTPNNGGNWTVRLSVGEILIGLQTFLNDPGWNSAAKTVNKTDWLNVISQNVQKYPKK